VFTTSTQSQIQKEIKDYIDQVGGAYSSWYVGISENPRERLFNDHGVIEKTDRWIFRTASSSQIARSIEAYFVDTLGTDGGKGGGDEDARSVYAYKKNSHTTP